MGTQLKSQKQYIPSQQFMISVGTCHQSAVQSISGLLGVWFWRWEWGGRFPRRIIQDGDRCPWPGNKTYCYHKCLYWSLGSSLVLNYSNAQKETTRVCGHMSDGCTEMYRAAFIHNCDQMKINHFDPMKSSLTQCDILIYQTRMSCQ